MADRVSAFRAVPLTGVIYVSTEAEKRGFFLEADDWCNLGQGQPETGALPGSPQRLTTLNINADAHDYAPVGGLLALRASVADYYNRTFRRGKKTQYSAENVAICAGGRLAVARAAATLGSVNVGHFLPDYTAYEELLDIFRVFSPIPILLEGDRQYRFSPAELEREVLGRGLSALLLSNPCNPTGNTLHGSELAHWVDLARHLDLALIVDEFYSHYVWHDTNFDRPCMVSAAEHIEDIEEENVVVIDGLTKNWRYPGLRISWTLGPKHVIKAITSAGSFLDGGANRPAQQATLGLLEDNYVQAENCAIRRVFSQKRDFLLSELRSMGIRVEAPPQGGFYVWGRLDQLPQTLQLDMNFFKQALEHKVIAVPGHFFDINPGGRRRGRPSRFENHMRFSFGPPLDVLQKACQHLRQMIEEHARAKI